ncbi:MAG: tetratricopeptide repeat protein [Caldilineales bacterium]|nr:tetratricopeptide repeat protein [Caldilineales bacterium]MCW5857156.1 tetratricopeptide repeat protein [Caldilineales bacterium]
MHPAEAAPAFVAGKERSARYWLDIWAAPSRDMERLDDARRHGLRVVKWCAEEDGLLDLAIDLAIAMSEHMTWRGNWQEWEEVLRSLFGKMNPIAASDRHFALREALSALYFRQHRLDESIALSGENYHRARADGAIAHQARAALNLAEAHLNAGAAEKALAYAEELRVLAARIGSQWQEADAHIDAARALAALNCLAEAEQRLWQGHALAVAAGLPVYQAKAHIFLGHVACHRQQWQEALARFETALALVVSYGDEVGRATVQSNIGRALTELGRWQEAIAILEDAVRTFRYHGNAPAERIALQRLQDLETRRSKT